jgi:hypothetical protein
MAVGVDVRVHGHGREEDDLCFGGEKGKREEGKRGGGEVEKKKVSFACLVLLSSLSFFLFFLLSFFLSLCLPRGAPAGSVRRSGSGGCVGKLVLGGLVGKKEVREEEVERRRRRNRERGIR